MTALDHELRRKGITATDITAIVGVSPYGRTAHDVYLSKVAIEETHETRAMGLGLKLEAIALSILAEERGLSIEQGGTHQHPIMPWVVASPDGLVPDSGARESRWRAVCEAKVVGYHMAKRWGEDGDPEAVPDDVRVQVQWQMLACRVKVGYVVALLGTEARTFELAHDDDLAGALLEAGDTFWRGNVVAREPPDIDSTEGAARMVRGLFRRATAGIIEAPAEAEELVQFYQAAKAQLAAAERVKDQAQAKLCALIGDNEGLDGGAWLATWKEREGSPDWKAIAESLGAGKDLVEKYRRAGTRVLLVKERKARAA